MRRSQEDFFRARKLRYKVKNTFYCDLLKCCNNLESINKNNKTKIVIEQIFNYIEPNKIPTIYDLKSYSIKNNNNKIERIECDCYALSVNKNVLDEYKFLLSNNLELKEGDATIDKGYYVGLEINDKHCLYISKSTACNLLSQSNVKFNLKPYYHFDNTAEDKLRRIFKIKNESCSFIESESYRGVDLKNYRFILEDENQITEIMKSKNISKGNPENIGKFALKLENNNIYVIISEKTYNNLLNQKAHIMSIQ